ncbi:hypothetical protein VTK73DRAFT_5274 [Phialemonium thermophilum]|uniref:Uncharacterized protein n=1 Tax=Phialemonium thermophilum TaxID=223376 RepID=A0ABR3V292_9PEZI
MGIITMPIKVLGHNADFLTEISALLGFCWVQADFPSATIFDGRAATDRPVTEQQGSDGAQTKPFPAKMEVGNVRVGTQAAGMGLASCKSSPVISTMDSWKQMVLLAVFKEYNINLRTRRISTGSRVRMQAC